MSRHQGHHHTEKADMIHHLLTGKSGLSIFEPCAFMNGKKNAVGACYKAYRQYASRHVAIRWVQSDPTTDWLWQVRFRLLMNERFDVVDLDGYGGPERPLLAGAVELVTDGGLLFCTYPTKGASFRFPGPRKQLDAVYGHLPAPTEQGAIAVRAGLLFNRRVEPISWAAYGGKVLRVAYRVAKFTSIRTRMSDVKQVRETIRKLQVA